MYDNDSFCEFMQRFTTVYQEFAIQSYTVVNSINGGGPHLENLPGEILSHLDQFLIDLQSRRLQLSCDYQDNLKQTELAFKTLCIICRNFDNIPFIASCNFVSNIIDLLSYLTRDLANQENDDILSIIHLGLFFLECIYDPYFNWRTSFSRHGYESEIRNCHFSPALLHIEVVPFIHDCFEINWESIPCSFALLKHCLHLFGGILSGSKHNALRACCPATLEILWKCLSDTGMDVRARDVAVDCLGSFIIVISKYRPDQTQVDVASIIKEFIDRWWRLCQSENIEINVVIVNKCLVQLQWWLSKSKKTGLQSMDWIDVLVKAFTLLSSSNDDRISDFRITILQTLTLIIRSNKDAMVKMIAVDGFNRLMKGFTSHLPLTMPLFTPFLSVVVVCQAKGSSRELLHPEVAKLLIRCVPHIENDELYEIMNKVLVEFTSDIHAIKLSSDAGMLVAVIDALEETKQFKHAEFLARLIEVFGSYSINPSELHRLLKLLRPQEDGKHFPYLRLIMRAISSMAKLGGLDNAHYFFDFQEAFHGIDIPAIDKWPGYSFCFHAWVRLDDVSSSLSLTTLYRRQLYSITTATDCGFEAFFTPDGMLVVAVLIKKEYITVSLPKQTFNDSKWHSIGICHSGTRRPFMQGQLVVYIDGIMKLTTQLKCPSLSETFVNCRIASGRQKLANKSFVNSTTGRLFSNLQFSTFLSLPTPIKPSGNNEGVTVIDIGRQDQIWGVAGALQGQISSVTILHDVLQPLHFKCMHLAGPNFFTLFLGDDADLFELNSKLILYYHAKAFNKDICNDLSPGKAYDGIVNGYHGSSWDVKESLVCVGGIAALFPILENCQSVSNAVAYQQPSVSNISRDDSMDEWVVVSSPSFSEWKIEQNEAAGFFVMLKNLLLYGAVYKDPLINSNGVATIGLLLKNIPCNLIDVNLLMAVQLLMENIIRKDSDVSLCHAFYQYILFDFKIWSRSTFTVQIGHIQHLSTIIKDDRKYFRKKYGIRYLLDVMRQFYSFQNSNLCFADTRAIRLSLFGLIKYFISKDVNSNEIDAIMGFLISVKDETMLSEMVDILLTVMEHPQCKDQLFLLIYEPCCVELFYCLLMNPMYSIEFRCRVLKLISVILNTNKVYEKYKIRLRLQDIGLAGLISRLEGLPVSVEMAKLLVDQVLLTDNVASWQGLLVVLYFIRFTDANLKLEILRKVAQTVLLHTTSLHLIGLQQGWHDCILELLIKQPISGAAYDESLSEKVATTPGLPAIPPSLINVSGSPVSFLNASPKISNELSPKLKFQSCVRPAFDFDIQSLGGRSQDSKASSTEDLSASQSSDTMKFQSVEFKDAAEEEAISNDETPTLDVLNRTAETLGLESLESGHFSDAEDELCQLVCNITYLVMWRGITGSDKRAWRERGQVFTCINILALSNHLYRSHLEIKRRVLEMMLNAAVFDLKEAGQANAYCTENAMVVMKWTFDFIVIDSSRDYNKKLSGKLLDGILALLDTLMVLEEHPHGDDWTDMAQMGVRILLECATSDNLEICSMATPKLHTLIQTRLTWSKVGEVFFFLDHLDQILIQTVELKNQDHYSFIIPLIKALLETAGPRLHLYVHLPHLPTNLSGPSLYDEFQQYCQTAEWRTFIAKQVRPVALRYSNPIIQVIPDAMNDFWNDCCEETMISIHKRNREWGESRLRFQVSIMDPFSNKCIEEQARYNNGISQLRNQSLIVRRRWRLKKLFLQGLRGPWQRRNEVDLHWKLSHFENISRMRLKLILNHNFDIHAEASRLRDNLGIPVPQPDNLPLAVALEVRNSKQQDNSLNEEDVKAFLVTEIQELELSGKEKLILTEDCELVYLMSVIKGRLELTTTCVYFFDVSPVKNDAERYDFKFALDLLEELHLRRYNLRRSALEFFLIDQTTYFLNFDAKVRNKVFTRILSLRPSNLSVYSNGSPADVLRTSGYTQKWMNREISNFDYLMILNTIAGRTYNDLSQYPVFPWILVDYSSEELDLENPKIFRDLSRPVGVVNDDNIPVVKAKYEQFEDPSGFVEKFHYGTHYSNSAGVLQYLVRLEPFTTLHIELQSNRFDVADRQFHSIPGTWKMLMENSNDVKELIPEFFYLPEFLLNMNGFDLGRLQISKEMINDVVLPLWANDLYDFIFKHRKALESDYVSSHLHEWIDLIFGYKQKGPAAVDALNVFYYCSYEGAVNLDSISDPFARTAMEGMINNFGQTPCQLLTEPHPVRLSTDEIVQKCSKIDSKGLSLFLCLNNLRCFEIEVSATDDPIIFMASSRTETRFGLFDANNMDPLITVSQSGIIGIHNWLPYNKSISSFFTLDVDPTTTNAKTQRKFAVPFQPDLRLTSSIFAVAFRSKLLYSGGHWDNTIRVFRFSKSKAHMRLSGHKDVVTCLAVDRLCRHLLSGSRDMTCILWDVSRIANSTVKDVQAKILHILCGHDKEVTCVALMTELDVAVSSSKDGTVNVYTMRDGLYLRTLRPFTDTISYEITNLSLSLQGYIVFSTVKAETKQNKYAHHLYSINGRYIWEEALNASTVCLVAAGDYIVSGNSKGQLNINELHELRLLKSLSLPSPVGHITITNRNTHILASLNNGHIMVICVALPVDIK
ncbi:Neurobeachin-like protein 1 [Chamberlinius hualienensis]